MKILLCWEMGAGYGHLASLRIAAKELVKRGHECLFAVADTHAARHILEPDLGRVFHAPQQSRPGHQLPMQFSHATILYNAGFNNPEELSRRIKHWSTMMLNHHVDAVVADYSPIALVAARALGLPRTVIGCGFDVPPLVEPFPAFPVFGSTIPETTLIHNEEAVCTLLNGALVDLGFEPYEKLQHIYSGAKRALLTYAEMDHYEGRQGDEYLGLPDDDLVSEKPWPSKHAKRVFAYLRPHAHLDEMLAALRDCDADVLLVADQIEAHYLTPYLRPGLFMATRLTNLRHRAQQCDAWLSYSPHGTSTEMLLAGKPGVVWPDTLERELVGRRLAQSGGVVVMGDADTGVDYALSMALEEDSLREGADRFAQKYAAQDRSMIPARLADIILSPR